MRLEDAASSIWCGAFLLSVSTRSDKFANAIEEYNNAQQIMIQGVMRYDRDLPYYYRRCRHDARNILGTIGEQPALNEKLGRVA